MSNLFSTNLFVYLDGNANKLSKSWSESSNFSFKVIFIISNLFLYVLVKWWYWLILDMEDEESTDAFSFDKSNVWLTVI